MPGMMYERKRGWESWPTSKCTVHGGYEMYHTCAGGPGEPMGYCSAAPDTESCYLVEVPTEEVEEGMEE